MSGTVKQVRFRPNKMENKGKNVKQPLLSLLFVIIFGREATI
jgi:hypothetical protein